MFLTREILIETDLSVAKCLRRILDLKFLRDKHFSNSSCAKVFSVFFSGRQRDDGQRMQMPRSFGILRGKNLLASNSEFSERCSTPQREIRLRINPDPPRQFYWRKR